jgi:hypothetical protein
MAYGTVDDVFDCLHHCCPGFQVHWRSGRRCEGLEVTGTFLIGCWFHVDDCVKVGTWRSNVLVPSRPADQLSRPCPEKLPISLQVVRE